MLIFKIWRVYHLDYLYEPVHGLPNTILITSRHSVPPAHMRSVAARRANKMYHIVNSIMVIEFHISITSTNCVLKNSVGKFPVLTASVVYQYPRVTLRDLRIMLALLLE